ncbi:hypothetical protein M0P98_09010 [bacterium]|nr:hypothetical protein [bacterium]
MLKVREAVKVVVIKTEEVAKRSEEAVKAIEELVTITEKKVRRAEEGGGGPATAATPPPIAPAAYFPEWVAVMKAEEMKKTVKETTEALKEATTAILAVEIIPELKDIATKAMGDAMKTANSTERAASNAVMTVREAEKAITSARIEPSKKLWTKALETTKHALKTIKSADTAISAMVLAGKAVETMAISLEMLGISQQRTIEPTGAIQEAVEMNIPSLHKENDAHENCQVVAIQMALAYYGIDLTLDKLHKMVPTIGPTFFSVPWGNCAVAAEEGLNVIFISRNPNVLLEASYIHIANSTQKTRQEIEDWIKGQRERCNNLADKINLVEWRENWKEEYGYEYKDLPLKIVAKKAGVVIPTVNWGIAPHAIVINEFKDGKVFFNNPNKVDITDMAEDKFYQKWLDTIATDNDLLIISKDKIDLRNI